MNRHPLDSLSLGFGTAFLVVAAGWLATRWLTVHLPSPGWLAASGLILLGILGLVTTLLPRRGGGRPSP
jgi:drug/metabolite transporter superfamily protein YnfA